MADPARAVSELVSWAEQLHLETTDPSDRAKANALIGCIRGRSDALVVLDNLEDASLLDRDLPGLVNSRPRGLGCKLLITSRQQVPDCQEIRLDFLPSPLDSALLLREAKRAPPFGEDVESLKDLLTLLGGLPLALVMTGRLLAAQPERTLASLRNALRHRGAISVLSERGQIPSDYFQKIGSSFGAVLSEIWDALPEAEADLRRRILMALALFGESAFVPEEVLPLMLKLPGADPDGLDPPPLEQALSRLEAAQLVERNREQGKARLHPLIHDFTQRRQELGSIARVLDRVARELDAAAAILAIRIERLSEIARSLDSLSKLASGSGDGAVVADLCRLLRVEAQSLSLTAEPASGTADPAQLAYLAGLHGRAALKAAAEEAANANGRPYLRLLWTTAKAAPRSVRYRLRGHDFEVKYCALSSDGCAGFSVSYRTLIVWNLITGEERRRFKSEADGWAKSGWAVSADGRTGLSGSRRALIVWNLETGEERCRLHGHEAQLLCCAISADGLTGFSASEDQKLITWDLATAKARHRLRGHEDSILDCAVSADGRVGLSASRDGTLVLWNLAGGTECNRLRGHKAWVTGCAVSADGRTGLSASADRTSIIWDLDTGERRYQLSHEDGFSHCAISADGLTGFTASEYGQTLIEWDLTTGKERKRLRGHEGAVTGCAISANGRTGFSASKDGTLIVWDLTIAQEGRDQRAHEGGVACCAVSSDGHTGVSAGDGISIVWDLATGEERHRLECGADGCAISADGRVGLLASPDRNLIAFDLVTGAELHGLRPNWDYIIDCVISPDGRTGLAVSSHRTLIVWDIASGTMRQRLQGREDDIRVCALAAEGSTGLSAGGWDGILSVWDLATGKERQCLRGHEAWAWIVGCAISADGRTGLSIARDCNLVVWDTSSGCERHRAFLGHVLGCAISADGRMGLSSDVHPTLVVWDLVNGTALCCLALSSITPRVALSSTGVVLLGDHDGNVTCLELVVP
jgi:WD40 repeat protein